MQKWYQIFQRNTGLSPYVWVVFYILPFYFIFRSSSTYEVVSGIVMIVVFFVCYVLSFVSRGWLIYFWTTLQIVISIAMTLLFGYVYFSLFIAFFIGNLQHRAGFMVLYTIHLMSTIVSVNLEFVSRNPVFISQLPFVLITLLAVILLPVTTYNRNRSDKLQGQLEDANKRISELVKLEERQRIARDLHDTLGQKLSLIGLKSDLAGKLVRKDPGRALSEINDVRQTARSALKEVREMVTQMRGTSLEEELFRVRQILKAAEIEFTLEGDPKLENTSLLTENVLSMCVKEAVTNIVKHSRATACTLSVEPGPTDLVIRVRDNGIGMAGDGVCFRGNGLRGMKERLEFVNGSLDIRTEGGVLVTIRVPNTFSPPQTEAGL
ncbi:sensor histidine kinase [Paenibacillus mucilaginosus]|uniref:histidine kinase n=3 Tax=Paenibacillus mucilaginosus TaxID=61624 RepID=H6NPP6_9BACL|nr:sensor histidine kinase [Paenibacillus mucilaginosus]AEI45739.1 DesK [Paenibacillus mucilaginosus KNP414]AFC33402.1 DesK [Paenibacillus mucilaginosus 3016]AFH65714.1 sensor histidine kinase [Paenibacillus mucilaginosus K02]MCG7215076.1 sensor histidine kinase [Paenibacillus mucilaginosus]WDM27123.1 sensor histidine kinase [Paenibacillus mucilaginosus]